MAEDLPTEYDVIVIGTGLVESIVAAAVGRIGKRVLHLDGNSYYGHHWATFNLEGLQNWCETSLIEPSDDNGVAAMETENGKLMLFNILSEKNGISNIKQNWYEKKKNIEHSETDKNPSEENLPIPEIMSDNDIDHCKQVKEMYRKFNFDLVPKLLYAKGEMVDLLIKSQVSRYTEFVSVTNILTYINGRLEPVPCSKADIFSSKNVSVVNKRILMRIITSILSHNDESSSLEGFEDKKFHDYLEAQKMPRNLHQYMYAISMSSGDTVSLEAVSKAQKFLKSLGYYGNTPFLWPMYGSSELLQAYCRLCAVFGGIYYLGKRVNAICVNEQNKCSAVQSNNQLLFTEHVVMSALMAPKEFLVENNNSEKISRGILITDKPLFKGEKDGVTFFQYDPENKGKEVVTLMELSSNSGACPKGYYLVHLISKLQKQAEDDFEEVLRIFFSKNDTDTNESSGEKCDVEENDTKKPSIIYSLFFEIEDTTEIKPSPKSPENVHVCSGPDFELDFGRAIKQAMEIFSKMYPEESFLEAAPPNPGEESTA